MERVAPTTRIRIGPSLEELLAASAARHSELCPRQVLGVRMGLLSGELLELQVPRRDKRLLIIAETDGCLLDGLAVATGCSPGRRTMRIQDFGKVAATAIDVETKLAIRIVPHPRSRVRAFEYAPGIYERWEAQLVGYRRMPSELLFRWESVDLTFSLESLLAKDRVRTVCQSCGEEIINGREVVRSGRILCRACAGEAYYRL